MKFPRATHLLNRLAIHYGLRKAKKKSEAKDTHTLEKASQTSHEPPNKPSTGKPCETSGWEH
ncbi:MAG TPA: hypothetical protein DCW46_01350 [Desulfotomaculum sp.]|nr:hypothetical protein [Desulfotomaculum sp.]